MTFVGISCNNCQKKFPKELRRFNESMKQHWKHFCSPECSRLSKITRKTCQCSNPVCNKIFERELNQISITDICFCSRSCAATVNNPKSPKRVAKIRTCPSCNSTFTGDRTYCSSTCIPHQLISKDQILETIISFFHQHQRIPLKREFSNYKAARNRFGTWNKAIIAAGFKPNPVRFANRHIANDGHECDSFAEKIIDDWLYAQNIHHDRSVPYNYRNMTADFKIDGVFVEFLGLQGELDDYDRLVSIKQTLWRQLKLKIITITPNDLFPQNKLSSIFARFVPIFPKQQTLKL